MKDNQYLKIGACFQRNTLSNNLMCITSIFPLYWKPEQEHLGRSISTFDGISRRTFSIRHDDFRYLTNNGLFAADHYYSQYIGTLNIPIIKYNYMTLDATYSQYRYNGLLDAAYNGHAAIIYKEMQLLAAKEIELRV